MKEECIEIISDGKVNLEIDVSYLRKICDILKKLEISNSEDIAIRRIVNGSVEQEVPVVRKQNVIVNEEWVNELLVGCTKHNEFYNNYLHGISYLRIIDDFNFISKHLKTDYKVLEVGALPPLLDLVLNEKGGVSDITVLDPNASEFSKFFDKRKMKYIEADITEMEKYVRIGEYDVIIISAVWEHLIVDIYQLMKVIHSRLKKDGLLFLQFQLQVLLQVYMGCCVKIVDMQQSIKKEL